MPYNPTYDLRGKTISSTFQNLVQYDTSSNISYDGKGNVASLSVATASFAVITPLSTLSISSSYSQTASLSKNGTFSQLDNAYFGDRNNAAIANSASFPIASVGQMLMTYGPGIGGSSMGQLWSLGANGVWRRDLMLGRLTSYVNDPSTDCAVFAKVDNGVDNCITLQNNDLTHYSSMRWVESISASGAPTTLSFVSERGAVGYGNVSASFYPAMNYLESYNFSAGFYFVSNGHLFHGMEKGINGDWIRFVGGTVSESIASNKVVRIDGNGNIILSGSIYLSGQIYTGNTAVATGANIGALSQSILSNTGQLLSSSYATTASFALNGGVGGGTTLVTASTYQITASRAISSSYSSTASFALNAGVSGIITASYVSGSAIQLRNAQSNLGINYGSGIGGGSFEDTYLFSTASYEGQIGISYPGTKQPFLYFAGKTGATGSDWLKSISIPAGINQIGDPNLMDPLAIAQVIWHINGSPQAKSYGGSSDSFLGVANWNAAVANSGTGLVLCTMGIDNTGSAILLQNNAIAWPHCPTNRVPSLIPGTTGFAIAGDFQNVKMWTISQNGAVGAPDNGNYTFFACDFVNGMTRIPYWQNGLYQVTDVAFNFSYSVGPTNPPALGDLYSHNGIVYEISSQTGTAIVGTANLNPTSTGFLAKSGSATGDISMSFSTWVTPSYGNYTFTVSGITTKPALGSVYRNGGINPSGSFWSPNNIINYVVTDTGSLTGTAPNILGKIFTAVSINPTISGTLSRVSSSVNGDNFLSFSGYTSSSWQDCMTWNPHTGITDVYNLFRVNGSLKTQNGNLTVISSSGLINLAAIDANTTIPALNTPINAFTFNATHAGGGIISYGFNDSSGLGSSGGELRLFGSSTTAIGTWGNTRLRFDAACTLGWNSDGSADIGSAGGASIGRPANIWVKTNVAASTFSASLAGVGFIGTSSYATTASFLNGPHTGSTFGTSSWSNNSISSSYTAISSLPYRAGQQSIGNLSTSQNVLFSTPLPTTSYAVTVNADSAVAATTIAATGKTTSGFTASLSAGIAGGVTVDYVAWLNN